MSLHQQTAHLSPVWARYSNIVADRAEGVMLYGDDGREYMDFTCGIGVTNTGHCSEWPKWRHVQVTWAVVQGAWRRQVAWAYRAWSPRACASD